MEKQQQTDPFLQLKVGAGVLASGVAVDMLAHGGWPGLILAGAASVLVARNSPTFYEAIKDMLPSDFIAQMTYRDEEEKFSTWDRLMGRHEMTGPLAVEVPEARTAKPRQTKVILPPAAPVTQLLSQDEDEETLDEWTGRTTALDMPTTYQRKALPGRYNFSEELRTFRPTPEQLFLGRSADGPVLIDIKNLWHVIFAGPTGAGKSKLTRLIFAQLLALDMQCYLCDPHYAPVSDQDSGDPLDWRPIEARLACPVLRKESEIADFLAWLVEELQARKERAYRQQPIGRPIFVCIEELAAVTSEYPEAAKAIGKLLREARKYRICLIMAAQDLLVKSIGLDTGMQQNIRTGFYGGGDHRTARVALKLEAGETVEEQGLGGGVVWVKTTQHPRTRVRIPWPDNAAIERLCTLSHLPVRALPHAAVEVELTEDEEDALIAELMGRPDIEEIEAVYYPPVEPVVPQTARRDPDEDLVERGVAAYLDGAKSLDKLAAALGVTQHKARLLKPTIEKRAKSRHDEQ